MEAENDASVTEALSAAEKQAAYRERKRLASLDAGMPWLGLIDEEREQAIRGHFGYVSSETRTQAERQAVADRIVANS